MTRLHHRHLVRTHFFDKIGWWIIRLLPLIALLVFVWAQRNLIMTRQYIYTAQDLPKSFVGYKVMHISDIVNSDNDVIAVAKGEQPDIIVLTGGYCDDDGDCDKTLKDVNKLTEIAPVYYIYSTDDEQHVLDGTNATNITNVSLELSPKDLDESTFIRNNYGEEIIKQYNKGDERAIQYVEYITEALSETKNSTVTLCGIDLYNGENDLYNAREKTFELIGTDPEKLTMMLNGNFGLVEEICRYTNTDMMFIGGTFGTNRLSDKYTKGLYGNRGTEIFVSGGIGERAGYTRFLNLPEIQVITLSDGTLTDNNPLENFIAKVLPDVGTVFDNDGGFQSYIYKYNNQSIKEENKEKGNTGNGINDLIKK